MNSLIIYSPEKNNLIKALDYTHLSFTKDDAYKKLDEVIAQNADKHIVFRINFENFLIEKKQTKLYNLPFIDIFVIHQYTDYQESDVGVINEATKYPLEYLAPLVKKESALAHIQAIKEKIKNGFFYQVNYALPFQGKTTKNLNASVLFKNLRKNFLGDFHALLPLGNGLHLLSFSPELFLKKDHENITTEPIKGTAPLGEEDKLLASSKENAELSMIVDLLRNDLNQISDAPVNVNFHRKILNLTHLSHTFSQISGTSKKSLGEILQKILPGGSISGCPKKESVNTIYELEPFAREAYTGIIGVIKNQKLKSSIVIRSLFYQEKTGIFTYNAGSGIVYDSNPEDEIREIFLKSKSIIENPIWEKSAPRQHNFFPLNSDALYLKEQYHEKEILFTTILVNEDGPKDLDLHLKRINHSLEALKRPKNFQDANLKDDIIHLIKKINFPRPYRLRINFTELEIFAEWDDLRIPTRSLMLDYCTTFKTDSNNTKLQHKLNQYSLYYEELNKRSNNVDDLIFINEKGNITETSKANIFIIDKAHQKLWTPPISDGVLPGIIRQKLIDQRTYLFNNQLYTIEEKSISLDDAYSNFRDGSYLGFLVTNSLIGIQHGQLKTEP